VLFQSRITNRVAAFSGNLDNVGNSELVRENAKSLGKVDGFFLSGEICIFHFPSSIVIFLPNFYDQGLDKPKLGIPRVTPISYQFLQVQFM